MPMGIVLILLIIQIFKKKKWPLFYGISILWAFSTFAISNSLIKLVEYPWERISTNEIEKSDGIVVLSGGGVKEISSKKRIIEWMDPDRFLNGIALFKRKKAKKLYFTDGYNPMLKNQRKSEGAIYLEEAKKLGINMQYV